MIKLALIVIAAVFLTSVICLVVACHKFDSFIKNEYKKKADVVFSYVNSELGENSFSYEELSADKYTDYSDNKLKIDKIKNLSGVDSLYLIKKTNNKIVYVVSSFDSYKKYYGMGTEIDNEIKEAAEASLSGEEIFEKTLIHVEKDKSVDTYLCIYPVADGNNNIIGAVGMEFNGHYNANLKTSIKNVFIPFIIIISLAVIMLLYIVINRSIDRIINRIISTDNLTGLKNRTAYEAAIEKVNNIIKNAPSSDPAIGVIMYDLNDLKLVNDSLGHLAGDKYIKNSAEIIDRCFSSFGNTYRIGGDEFVTIITNNSTDAVKEALSKFEEEQEKYNSDSNAAPFVMSISVGYDHFIIGTDLNLASVIKRADEKMYKAKKEKKRRFDRSPR